MTQSISPVLLAQLSDVIAAQMGLHFPRACWHDLEKGKCKAAAKHFETVLTLLSVYRPHEVLPESDGMTAGRLREIIASMYQQHTTQ